MPFLTFSNIDIEFAEKKLVWTTYIVAEALATIRKVKLFNKRDFAKAALDKDVEPFVFYISFLNRELIIIHLSWKAQIALLLTK